MSKINIDKNLKNLDNSKCYSLKLKDCCLVKAFFEHQKTLPIDQRSNICMISCPCKKCNPGYL